MTTCDKKSLLKGIPRYSVVQMKARIEGMAKMLLFSINGEQKIIPILKRYFSYHALCPSFGPEKIHYGIKPCFLVFAENSLHGMAQCQIDAKSPCYPPHQFEQVWKQGQWWPIQQVEKTKRFG